MDATMNTTNPTAIAPGVEYKPTRRSAALPAGMQPSVLNERAAATYLGISPRKMFELAAGGLVPCIRIGVAKRYRVVDLDAYTASLTGKGA